MPDQVKLEVLERELLEVNGNAERLARSFSELVELQLVLEKASAFFDDAQARARPSAVETRPTESAPLAVMQCPPVSGWCCSPALPAGAACAAAVLPEGALSVQAPWPETVYVEPCKAARMHAEGVLERP